MKRSRRDDDDESDGEPPDDVPDDSDEDGDLGSDAEGDSEPSTTRSSFFRTHVAKAQVLPLLQCNLCIDSADLRTLRLLNSPTTLPCGHSVCREHIQAEVTTCPVSGCLPLSARSSGGVTVPTLHPGSSVAIYPPPRPRKEVGPLIRTEDLDKIKLDLKVAAVLDLASGEDPAREEEDAPLIIPRGTKRIRIHAPSPPSSFPKALKDVLTCEVCFMLYYEPITLSCGHTFCAKCLQRTLDQDPRCPLCRTQLGGELCFALHMLDVRERDPPTNKTLLGIIFLVFPKEHMQRRQALENELRNAHAGGFDTPVYQVMEPIFPSMKTRLNFIIPSYRLMLRRILAAPEAKLGVIYTQSAMTGPAAPVQTFGTFVTIKSVQFLHDNGGVAEVEADLTRFRVKESKSIDGYTVARIELIDDIPDLAVPPNQPPPPPSDPPENPPTPPLGEDPTVDEMIEYCRKFIEEMGTEAAPWIIRRFQDEYGAQPGEDDPVAFGWWAAGHLPIDHAEKCKLLAIKSAKLRLRLICHWITDLGEGWWYSRGCIIC